MARNVVCSDLLGGNSDSEGSQEVISSQWSIPHPPGGNSPIRRAIGASVRCCEGRIGRWNDSEGSGETHQRFK